MKLSDFKNSNNLLDNEQMKNVKGGGRCAFLTHDGQVYYLQGYSLEFCQHICNSAIDCRTADYYWF